MTLDETAICEITRDVVALFGYEVRPLDALTPCVGIASSVAIDGPVSAIIEVQMPWEVAAQFAEVMTDDTSPGLVEDVAGEIVNMIGENVKGRLGGSSQLSIPSTNPDAEYFSAVPAPPEMQKTLGFECELGRFFVTVTMMGVVQ